MLSLHSVVIEKAGRTLFAPLTFSFGSLHYGLVGSSGSGKTSLALVLSGLEEPDSGSVRRTCPVRLFRQQEDRPEGTVGDFLSGLWLTSAPAHPLWSRWLSRIPLDAPLVRLSGGEWMRVRLLRLLEDTACFDILDEPSNHLDREGRAAVVEFLRHHEGGLLLISHDRALLREVDEVVELTPQGLQSFGGAFDFYWEQRRLQRARQEEALDAAKRHKRLVLREARGALESQQRRMQEGKPRAFKEGLPKIMIGAMQRRGEETLGRLSRHWHQRMEAVEEARRLAYSERQADAFVRLDFASSAPPAGSVFASARGLQVHFSGTDAGLWTAPLGFVLAGRERWRITGPNGSGKSTLLGLLQGRRPGRLEGTLRLSARPLVCLDQAQGVLPATGSLLTVLGPASRFDEVALRNELAFYGFTDAKVHQPLASLSGGERLRAALAVAFLGPCIPEVLLLDEPTNNLDFQSQELLAEAVRRFEGLLVVASHDEDFVEKLGIGRVLEL